MQTRGTPEYLCCSERGYRLAQPAQSATRVSRNSPSTPLRVAAQIGMKGRLSEYVDAQRIVRVCATARFVRQPSGIPKGRRSWGRLLLVTYLGECKISD